MIETFRSHIPFQHLLAYVRHFILYILMVAYQLQMLYTLKKTRKSNIHGENVQMWNEIFVDKLFKNSPGKAEKTQGLLLKEKAVGV
jgi:hypothetical protein